MLAIAALHGSIARGQLIQRATFIADARIVTGDGGVLERGSLIVRGGRIEAVGAGLRPPFLAKKIDAAGKTITPGFIDVWSALGSTGGAGEGGATARAWDGFDRYARDDFREALRHGVTTIYVGSDGTAGINGTGSIVRLAPGAGNAGGKLHAQDVALCINLGSDRSAVGRVKTFASIRKQLKQAVEYRKSLEDYEEDLKEYLEKLEQRRKKEADASGDREGKKADDKEKPSDEKSPPPKDDEKEDDKEEGDDEGGDKEGQDEASGGRSVLEVLFSGGRRRLPDASGDAGDGDNGNDVEKDREDTKKDDKDELKKPKKPAFDAVSEVILKAIDRQLVVRIEAHRSADILNALALGDEFNLDVVIEGGTEAYLVADALAEAEAPVVLGPVGRTALFEDTQFRRHSPRNAEALDLGGVEWLIGSGGHDPRAARFVGLNAQMAMPFAAEDGWSKWDWIRRVTSEAARFLGLSDRLGKLAAGMEADLVIWSGDPGDPESIVERALVHGGVAYVAPRPGGEGS